MTTKEEKALNAVIALTAPEDNVADVLVSRTTAGAVFGTVFGMAKCMRLKVENLSYSGPQSNSSNIQYRFTYAYIQY
jgi:hypothetical protein